MLRKVIGILGKISKFPTMIYNSIILHIRNVDVGRNLCIHGRLFVRGNGKITIGNNVTINSSLESNPIGGSTRCIFHAISPGCISIGNHVGISNCAIVSRNSVKIGDWTKVGGNVKIYDTDFHSVEYGERRLSPDPGITDEPVLIGNDVFIGAHSIILKGVSIGDRSIVAAGSIVTKNIPSDELWGGGTG